MEQTEQTEQKEKAIKRSSLLRNRLVELYLWMTLAVLTLLPTFFYYIRYKSTEDIFLKFYNQFLIGTFIFLFPTLFKLIFAKLPFEYLRQRTVLRNNVIIENQSDRDVTVTYSVQDEKEVDYKFQCIKESKTISERIFARSGVYLLVGCLIAFIGVAVFYSPWFVTKSNSSDLTQRLLDYLPRFGALFFIEFIAFFFLKQYRIMLEEYRYYEAVKRKRQDFFNFIGLVTEYKDNDKAIEILKSSFDLSISNRIAAGETTDTLEIQKLVDQDLNLFTKLTDLVKAVKAK